MDEFYKRLFSSKFHKIDNFNDKCKNLPDFSELF